MILVFYFFDLPLRVYIIPPLQCLDTHRLKTKYLNFDLYYKITVYISFVN